MGTGGAARNPIFSGVKPALPIIVTAALIALSGCGETIVDPQAAESDVLDGLGDQLGVRIESVRCPGDFPARAVATFECIAETPRGTLRISYRLLDDQGAVGAPVVEKVGLPGDDER